MNDQLLQPINDPSLLQATHSGRSSSIREKLSDMFTATEYVRVINPDTEAHVWQYLPASKERIEFDTSSSTVPQKITYRDTPEVYKLDPGQSAVIPGANAYLMIETLTKRLMAKRVIAREPNVKPGQARNFNFSDDAAQVNWINEIYLGKAMPTMASTEAPSAKEVEAEQHEIDKDLGIEDGNSTPAKRHRRTKAELEAAA